MLWFCAWVSLFLFIGSKYIFTSWFANIIFSISASAHLTYSIYLTKKYRLCPARLRKAIEGQKSQEDLQCIVEDAFGKDVLGTDPDSYQGSRVPIAGLPILFACFGLFGTNIWWRNLIILVIVILLTVYWEKLVDKIVAQKKSLKKAKQIVDDHNPQMWEQMIHAWNKRKALNCQVVFPKACPQCASSEATISFYDGKGSYHCPRCDETWYIGINGSRYSWQKDREHYYVQMCEKCNTLSLISWSSISDDDAYFGDHSSCLNCKLRIFHKY